VIRFALWRGRDSGLVCGGEGAQVWFVYSRCRGSGLVCVGEGAQVWFVEVKGLRFGLCR
jgi:hypothetical protein